MSKAKTTKSKSRGRVRAKATTGASRTQKAAKRTVAKRTDVRARRGESGSQAPEGPDGGRPEQHLLDE